MRRVIAFICEVQSCPREFPLETHQVDSTWIELVEPISRAVAIGWSLSLSGRLLSYCPDHAGKLRQCRCSQRGRAHRCTIHDATTVAYLWDATTTPADVLALREMQKLRLEVSE